MASHETRRFEDNIAWALTKNGGEMNTKWVVRQFPLIIAAIALLLMSSPAAAAPTVDKEVPLTPEPGSEVILKGFEATLWSDGSVSVGAGGHLEHGQSLADHWDVDLDKGTYKTTLLPPEDGLPAKGRIVVPYDTLYTFSIRVETQDPVNIVEARTSQRLYWTVGASGVNFATDDFGCVAMNPTAAGTHWYNDSCSDGGSSWNTSSGWASGGGHYYNWDWGDPSQETQSAHSTYVVGYPNGSADYNWGAHSTGDDSGLLHGSVYTGT